MSETQPQINLLHLDVELKLKALKARGIFECKFPDLLVGSVLMRMDHADPENPKLCAGKLKIRHNGSLEAGWFLFYPLLGDISLTKEPAVLENIPSLLDLYSAALDQFMVIADNGLLT